MYANKKNMVLFIVGPTAIGKTRLAIKLAKRIKGEIISCDSMQIYKRMDILSQAPSAAEMGRVKYHLVKSVDPKKEYSAAIFKKKAGKLINSIIKRKKIPIIVGGSGLYAKALIDGLFPSPEPDAKFRNKMQRLVNDQGSKELYKKLVMVDPDAAKKIHPNDARRIIRALEIYHSTGRTMTELKNNTKGLKDDFNIKIFGFTGPRELIYSNIDLRVEEMFKKGAAREVERLKRNILSKTAQAVLGYKEISGYLNGDYGMDEAIDIVKMNTRRYAKRQLTWFRADDRIRWFDVSRMGDKTIINNMVKRLEG